MTDDDRDFLQAALDDADAAFDDEARGPAWAFGRVAEAVRLVLHPAVAHTCDWCEGEDGAHETCCPESPDYEPPDPDLNAPDARELYERAWSEGRNPR